MGLEKAKEITFWVYLTMENGFTHGTKIPEAPKVKYPPDPGADGIANVPSAPLSQVFHVSPIPLCLIHSFIEYVNAFSFIKECLDLRVLFHRKTLLWATVSSSHLLLSSSYILNS